MVVLKVCIRLGGLDGNSWIWLVRFASVGILITLLSVFVLVLSEERLPFVACFGLPVYYLLSSCSSFTSKYQDLALAIFKQYKSYKKSRHGQVTDLTINTDSLLENTQNAADNKDNELKIPQKLFYMACEQLMPVRESFCFFNFKSHHNCIFCISCFIIDNPTEC